MNVLLFLMDRSESKGANLGVEDSLKCAAVSTDGERPGMAAQAAASSGSRRLKDIPVPLR